MLMSTSPDPPPRSQSAKRLTGESSNIVFRRSDCAGARSPPADMPDSRAPTAGRDRRLRRRRLAAEDHRAAAHPVWASPSETNLPARLFRRALRRVVTRALRMRGSRLIARRGGHPVQGGSRGRNANAVARQASCGEVSWTAAFDSHASVGRTGHRAIAADENQASRRPVLRRPLSSWESRSEPSRRPDYRISSRLSRNVLRVGWSNGARWWRWPAGGVVLEVRPR